VFEGDLPVRSTTFYENGNKEYEHLYVNGSMASDSRWYANGRFQSTSVFAGNSYAWVQYAQDGHKDSEGQWTYTEPAEGIYSLTTGWELRYHANGQKKELYHVANSKMEGLCQSWDDKGQIVEDGTYHDDKPWEGTFVNIRSEGGIRGSSTSIEGKPMVRHYREGKEVAE
jgi:antitoxin component YwqK of YwqJK toxin-antitoxin module